jgi:Ca2+-binding RTX toxin-like protein
MDDVRIWNKARTQAEIQADFNRELTGNESGLIGYWNFNSITNNTVKDLTSNHNDGTLVGAQSTIGIVPTSAIINNTQAELNETINLTLSNPTNGAILGTQKTATLTIIDDDFPAISISNITVVEGKDANAVLTVTLDRPSPQATTVDYSTKNRTALAGSDYTTTTGKLTFAANTTSQTITIPILNNDLNEASETFEVNLSNPVNGTLAKNQAIVTISDTLTASVTTTLTAQIENLTLTGTATISGTGNANGNVLTGNSANNILAGLGGDDTYKFVANSSLGTDTITETTTGGKDSLDFSGTNEQVRVNLGSSTNQTVVTGKLLLKLSATDVIENAIGGNGGDRLIGNALNNSLNGNTGKNTLTGANGADTLIGGAGDDFLSGGADSDSFFYGTGKAFATADIGLDTLTDFAPTTDKLSLSKTTFNALTSAVGNGFSQATNFAVVEDDAFVGSSSAFVVYNSNSGSLFYNQNGSLAGLGTGAEFALLLGTPSLTANSFALVI